MTADQSEVPAARLARVDRRDVFCVALLALATLALHGEIVRQWWTHEDGLVLLFALGHDPWELLFRPRVWQELSTAGFFPLLPLSFRLDFALAGLSPRFAYAHQLAALFGGAVLLYAYFRSFADRVVSTLAAAAVVAAPLTSLIVRQGMVRNYLEGMLLGAAAMICWRRRTMTSATAAAALWIAAALSKEAWILLPLFMAADSIGSREPLRRALERALPLVVAGGAYFAWRSWMLGSYGGYRALPTLSELAELPSVFWANMTLNATPLAATGWGFALLLFAAAAVIRLRARAMLVMALAALAATVPFMPVMELFFWRYAFVATVAVIGLSAAAAALVPRPIAWVAMALIFIAAHSGGRVVAQRENANARLMGAVGRYLFTAPSEAPPLLAPTYGPHVEGIVALRTFLGRGSSPRVFLSNWAFILEEDLPPLTASFSREGTIELRPTSEHATRMRSALDRYRPREPLTVESIRDETSVRWSYGPEGAKRWNVLTWPMYEVRPVPAEGWLRVQRPLTIPGTRSPEEGFRIRRIATDGTWTVSPVFSNEAGTTRWSRVDAEAGRTLPEIYLRSPIALTRNDPGSALNVISIPRPSRASTEALLRSAANRPGVPARSTPENSGAPLTSCGPL